MRQLYLNEGNEIVIDSALGILAGELTHVSAEGITVAVSDEQAARSIGTFHTVTLNLPVLAGCTAPGRIQAAVQRVTPTRRSGRDVIELWIPFATMARNIPSGPRFAIPEFYQPSASAPSPLFPGETVVFRITEVLRDHVRMTSRSRDKGLLPGVVLPLRVLLPTGETHEVEATILDVAALDKDEDALAVEATVANPPGAASANKFWCAMSELLLAYAGVSLEQLRTAELPIGTIDRALTFSSARPEDMDELMELRLLAFQNKGKRMHIHTAAEMRDRFDDHSRQIICRIGSRIVASARITFNDGDLGRSEYVSYGADLPEWLTSQPFVEVGRVVTHPEYRGSHIVFKLMQELARVAVMTRARYILGSASDTLKLYERVGFRRLGATYSAHGMTGVELIYLDVAKVFQQVGGLDFVSWNLIALPIMERIAATQDLARVVPLSPLRKVEILGHRLLHPAIKQLMAWRKRPYSRPARALPSPRHRLARVEEAA